MDEKRDGLIKRLLKGLLGKEDKKNEETLSIKSKIGALELDIKEKEEEIAAIKKEYDILKNDTKQAIEGTNTKAFERVYKELTNPLSQLLAMKRFIESGRDLATEDIFKVVDQIITGIQGQGVKMIGNTGKTVCFDSSLHQPAGTEGIMEGDEVQIRFVGFRLGETILKKAMVSSGTKK